MNIEQAASESMIQEEVRAPVRQLVRVGRSDVDLRRELSDVSAKACQTCEHRVLADEVGSKKGGRVAIQVWGRAERCDLGALLGAIAPLLPAPLPGPPGGGAYSDPGVLESIARNAGLEPETTGDIMSAFEYADEDALVRIAGSAGMIVLAARISGEQIVRDAIVGAMAPFRNADGSYHVENEWHYLIARA